jgi:solute carrier family 13 (sodium-dependent dicarboxylate transporter), member 2/3/5
MAPAGLGPTNLRKMLVGVALGVILFLLPAPEGLSASGMDTLALFALLIYFWATEALPLPVTALCAGVGLVLLGVVEKPNEAWSPYAQDTIFFLLGSLILADAVTKTDTDRVLSARLIRRMGGTTDGLLFAIIVSSALPAMFISDHAVAAVMLPLVISILRTTGLYHKRNIAAAYIIAIAFGANIAGLATPSGGARNAIVIGYLDELYGIKIGYLDWLIHAAPLTIILIPAIYFILKFIFKVPHEVIDRDAMKLDDSKLNAQQWATLLVIGSTVLLWIFVGEENGLGTVAIIGAVSLFVLGILDWVDTRRRIAWGVPLIYGAALTMGAQLQRTGAADWLARTLLGAAPLTGVTFLLIFALIVTVILTNFMSDGGTTAVLAPVTLGIAMLAMGAANAAECVDECRIAVKDMGLVTAIGSAFSFILVIGTPPNVIAYSSGLFTTRDLAKAGAALTVVALVVTTLVVRFYWPLLG